MVRINLLPPEILAKRRYEKWYGYVFLVFAVMLVIIAIFYGYFLLSGSQKNGDLQLLQEQSQKVQQQADAFGVFEQKEQDLLKRQSVVNTALASKIDMGKVSEELSLVLPDEVWLNTMIVSEKEGITLTGYTPRTPSHSMDVSYKSVAKTLVRINELDDVSDVWLTSAANAAYTNFMLPTGQSALEAPVVGLTLKGKIVAPSAETTGGK